MQSTAFDMDVALRVALSAL